MKLELKKRETVSRRAALPVPLASFGVSLLFGAILLAVSGANPLRTLRRDGRRSFRLAQRPQ